MERVAANGHASFLRIFSEAHATECAAANWNLGVATDADAGFSLNGPSNAFAAIRALAIFCCVLSQRASRYLSMFKSRF